MSEETEGVESGQEQGGTETSGGDAGEPTNPWEDPESARAEIERLRKESAQYRRKARDLEPLAKKAKEMEDAAKSQEQKLSEALAAAESRAAAAESANLRLSVAQEKGLPPELADRLVGDTREEMLADADKLLKATRTSISQVDLKQGARGKSSEPDPDAWLRRAAGR